MEDKTITYSKLDNCNFVQVSSNAHELDTVINESSTVDFLNTPEMGGGATVDSNFQIHGNKAIESDSSRRLAFGELECRSLHGMPASGDASKLDPTKILVNVRGMEMQLSSALQAGFAEVKDGVVRERIVAPVKAKPAAPIRGADLGEGWERTRRQNPAADAILASVISAVSSGKEGAELDAVLKRYDEAMRLGLHDTKQIAEVYNEGLRRLKDSMVKTMERAMPSLKGEGADILAHYLGSLDSDTRTSICQRALYGETSWVGDLKRRIEKDIRKQIYFKGNI
jgi:hypothetical protein